MNSDQKTRLLIGTLVAAVIIVVGYALFQGLGGSSQPVVQPAAPAAATPAPGPEPEAGAPLLRIQADSSVIAGTDGHQASITADSELSYEWSIQGGTIEGSTSSPSITWTAGKGAEAVLTCKGTNTADKTSTVSLRILLRQPPAIARFEASQLIITEGASTKLSWTATNMQKLILEPGGQDVSKYDGPAMDVKPGKTTTYTLTASNSTGIVATRELEVKVIPPPEISAFRAEPVAGAASTFTVIGEFKGGRAELKNGSQVVISSETSPLRIQMTDLKEGGSLLLTVSNEAGAYVSSSLNFSIKKP
jgi:hypothetical protein